MKITPYLNFDCQCKEAIEFYAKCLGGKVDAVFPYTDSPMAKDLPPDAQGRVMHASLTVGDQTLMAADTPPGESLEGDNIYVSLHYADAPRGRRSSTPYPKAGLSRCRSKGLFGPTGSALSKTSTEFRGW